LYEQVGVYDNFDDLCDNMAYTFEDIASAKISDYEEGAVLYLVKRDTKFKEMDEVLSLCKLKTLEYRIFRKIREKLRNFTKDKTKLEGKAIVNKF
jgi:hypothetical protein